MSSVQKPLKPKKNHNAINKPGLELTQSEWEQRLTELYAALRAQPMQEAALTHSEIQELLPSYLTIEQSGSDPTRTYPLVNQHLRACPQCNRMYEQLKSAMGILPHRQATSTLVVAQPQTPTFNYTYLNIVHTPSSHQRLENFQFLIPFPQSVNQPTRAFSFRSAMPSQGSLLFSAQVTLDNHPVLVQAWLTPTTTEEYANVRVELAAALSITRRVRASLDWGSHHFEQKFSRGVSTFKNILLSAFDSSFSLTLEFHAHERSRPHPPTRSTTRKPKRAAPKTRAKKA